MCFIVPISVTNYEVKQNTVHLYLKCHLWILFSLILWGFVDKISLQVQYLAKLESICKTSTWSWQLWHMCLGIVRDNEIYENWVHVGVTCHNTTLSARTCFCDSQYHLPQNAGKANLLHRSLLGKIISGSWQGLWWRNWRHRPSEKVGWNKLLCPQPEGREEGAGGRKPLNCWSSTRSYKQPVSEMIFSTIKDKEGYMPGTDIPLGKQQIWKPGKAIFKCKLIGLRAWVNKRQHPQVTRENRQPPINSSTFSWVWLVCHSPQAALWLCIRRDMPEALPDSQTLCQ